ncbi:MAG: 5'-methylthioadenosine/S-adenosylhomocysteine nucleosidase [Clostridia bacterium]|nr:5'-methylthioadenosine/S-adenosylhomocysteine nucleosidase [Clostridia bacterium]
MKVFIIAMDKEAEPVVDAMKKVKSSEMYGRKVFSGKIGAYKTAVIVSGVGKSNAAAATQLALSEFKADAVINIGTAGALTERCMVGAIYGIRDVVQYDFDLTKLNHTEMGTLDEYNENFLKLHTIIKYPLRRLGTGDRFNDDKADYKLLTKDLGADIRDMECGAIAHVCRRADVPAYAFKVITDTAGSGCTPQQFSENFDMCVKLLADSVKDILKDVEKTKK